VKGFLSFLSSGYTFLNRSLLVYNLIITSGGFIPVLPSQRHSWYNEMLSIVRELKMNYSEVLEMPICDRRSYIYLHNKYIDEKQSDSGSNNKSEPPEL
jgi:hypothetical protein